MKDELFYQDKIDGLFNHLKVAESDEKTAAYVIENLGRHIDKKAQKITEGICEGLNIIELIHLFELVEKRLPEIVHPQVQPESPKEIPTSNVKRRKSTK